MDGSNDVSQLNFKELFQAHSNKESNQPENKSRFILSIGYYFLVMIILSSFLFLALDVLSETSFPELKETITIRDETNRLFNEYDNILIVLPNSVIDSYLDVDTYPFEETHFVLVYEGYDGFLYVNNIPTITSDIIQSNLDNDVIQVATALNHVPESLSSITILYELSLEDQFEFTAFTNSLLNFLVYLLLFPVIVLFLKPYIFIDLTQAKTYQSKWISLVVAGYLYVLAGNIISNVLIEIMQLLTNTQSDIAMNQAIIMESLQGNCVILMVISAVLLGPIVEELIFRKAIFGLFKNNTIAMIVSSFAFGIIHVLSEPSIIDLMINIIPYLVMGFVFGYLYIKHERNLFVVTIVHILTNLISIISILLIY
jgi:membrane protease YdiL (CAAX protease family)